MAFAQTLGTRFAQAGLEAAVFNDVAEQSETPEQLQKEVERYDTVVVVVSKNSARDAELSRFVEIAGRNDANFFTARLDAVSLDETLSFYLQVAQWADINIADPTAIIDELAAAISNGTPLVAKSQRKIGGQNTRWLLISLIFLLFAVAIVTGIVWRRGQVVEATASVKEQDRLVQLLTPPQPPDIAIMGNGDPYHPRLEAHVYLQQYGVQESGVEAALYSKSATGVLQLIGKYDQNPDISRFEVTFYQFKFFVASDPAQGVFCMIYDQQIEPDVTRRQYLLQDYPAAFPRGKMIEVGVAETGKGCDDYVQANVDPSQLAELEVQAEIERISKSHSYLSPTGIENEGTRIVPKTLRLGGTNYVNPVRDVTYYYFAGGEGNWAPIAKKSSDDSYGELNGVPPAELMLCVDTYVKIYKAHLSTFIVAKKDADDLAAPYRVISPAPPPKLSHEGSSCEELIAPGQSFPQDDRISKSDRVLPQGSQGVFSAAETAQALASIRSGDSRAFGPTIAGMSLGMSFDDATRMASEIVGVSASGDPSAFAGLLAGYSIDAFDGLMRAKTRNDIRYFVDENLGYGFALAPLPSSTSLGSLWLAYRPSILEFEQAEFSFSGDEYSPRLIAVYGPPDEREGYGTANDNEELLRLTWSGISLPACTKIKSVGASDSDGLGQHTTEFRCWPHLSALRFRQHDNASNLLWLHTSQ